MVILKKLLWRINDIKEKDIIILSLEGLNVTVHPNKLPLSGIDKLLDENSILKAEQPYLL